MTGRRRSRVGACAGLVLAAVLALTACSGSPETSGPSPQIHGADVTSPPPPPLHFDRVVAPKHLRGRHSIVVKFSRPLAATTPTPVLDPKIAGHWVVKNASEIFTPTRAYPPQTKIKVTMPSGPDGTAAADGGRLPNPKHRSVLTAVPSVTFAEQILARLHYLPYATTAAKPANAVAESEAVYNPPAGKFTPRWNDIPASLSELWQPSSYNTVLRGAVLAFQHRADITPDALLGPRTWKALLRADEHHRTDPWAYSYIYAELSHLPQTLTVWEDGKTVITTPTNGGVPGALTPDGTFPIYERLTSTTMSGTNPDGSKYSDPGVPWVNYFSGGSAVHGFPRSRYGYPQSVGCLELPIPTAEKVFDIVNYGTLVTVAGQLA